MSQDKPSFENLNLFRRKKKNLIKNGYLLSPEFIPEVVVPRMEQVQIMAENLEAILDRDNPKHMYLWGGSGVGKSITIKMILKTLETEVKNEGTDIFIDIVNLNGTSVKTDMAACVSILNKLTGLSIQTGKSIDAYYNDIWNVIDRKASEHSFYVLVLVIDEIDLFTAPDDLIYQFSRAKAQEFINSRNVAIELIAASNQHDYLKTLAGRVISALDPRYIDFPDYSEDELFEIIQKRKNAFTEDAITDEVIRYCAKRVSEKFHGDARRCLNTLVEAASIAAQENSNEITVDHIKAAEEKIITNVTLKMLQKITLHDKILLRATYIANKTIAQTNSELPPNTGVVLEAYRQICYIIGEDPNGDTYVSSRIRDLNDRHILVAAFYKGHGNTKFVTLSNDIAQIINDLFSEEFNRKIEDNYSDIESAVLAKIKRPFATKSLTSF